MLSTYKKGDKLRNRLAVNYDADIIVIEYNLKKKFNFIKKTHLFIYNKNFINKFVIFCYLTVVFAADKMYFRITIVFF